MRTSPIALLGALLFTVVNSSAANWPAWRNDGTGVSKEKNVPLKWSATENVRWRTALPAPGNGSPIVWEDRVFITQAEGERREVMCFDRKSGRVIWRAGTTYGLKERTHETNPFGSPTPVTDGERVIAWFGTSGLMCFDMNGKELWRRELGKQDHIWGYGSSPVIHGDLCFLHFGPGERSFLIAVEKKTGKTVWQVDIPQTDPPERHDGFAGKQGQPLGSWSTPLIANTDKRTELILSVTSELRSFDPATGKELWKTDGLSPLVYTSPIFGEGVVMATGGFGGSTVAVKAGGNGDLSAQKLWHVQKEKKNRISTGAVSRGHIFLCNMDGVAQCIELQTGKDKWLERLRATGASGEIWGSTLLVGDNVMVVNQSGDTIVFKANPEKFEVVSTNPLKERSNSTPAISNGEIFIRTYQALWCITAENSQRASLR